MGVRGSLTSPLVPAETPPFASVRLRRVPGRWPSRRRYEVELLDAAGAVVESCRTRAVGSFLVSRAGVHPTDTWDWVHAADTQFARGSDAWVTDPFDSYREPRADR